MDGCTGQRDGGWDLPRGRLAEEVRKKRQTQRHKTGSMVKPWELDALRLPA